MTDNVIPFKPADPLIFVCGCGCQSFRIQSNDTFECCNCHDVKASGEWVKHLPDVPNEPPERDSGGTLAVTAIGNKEFAMRRVIRQIEDWAKSEELAALSAFTKDGSGKHWFDVETEEQKQWILRRINDIHTQLEELAI